MRDKGLFDKSKSTDDRLGQLELVATRLARRSGTKKAAMITPYPISSATFGEDIRGPILRYMFPCDGVVQKGMMKLDKKPKGAVSIELTISNEISTQSRGYVIDKRQIVVEPNIEIKAGDCLTIQISSDESEKVTEVWVSFLWVPSVSDITTKSFLIEELEHDILEAGN